MKQLIFNTHDIILLITMYQCLLFAGLIVLIKPSYRYSDIFLVLFLFVHAFIPFHLLLNYGEGFRLIALDFWPGLFRLFEVSIWLEGPLMLWYTRSIVYEHYRFSAKDLLYLVPAVLYGFYLLITFYTLNETEMVQVFYAFENNQAPGIHYEAVHASAVWRVMLGVACMIEIHRCQRKIRNWYSSVENIDIDWLIVLITIFFLLNVLSAIISIASVLNANYNINFDLHLMGLTCNYITFLMVSALIFFNLKLSSTLKGIDEKAIRLHESKNEKPIDPDLVLRLEQHIEVEKPYLANILTLEQLANQIEISPRVLSNIINRHFKKNFFEFINHHRIQEARVQLENTELAKKNIIDVMNDCGFNSKATFNTFFKKVVGCTPSQYRARFLAKT